MASLLTLPSSLALSNPSSGYTSAPALRLRAAFRCWALGRRWARTAAAIAIAGGARAGAGIGGACAAGTSNAPAGLLAARARRRARMGRAPPRLQRPHPRARPVRRNAAQDARGLERVLSIYVGAGSSADALEMFDGMLILSNLWERD